MLKKLVSISFVAVTLMVAGCAKAPKDEVALANAAIENAKAAQADVYFAEDFSNLSDSIKVALAEIAQQDQVSAFKRNYDHAKLLLTNATREINALTEKTGLRKEEVQLEVKQLLIDVAANIDEAKAAVVSAPKNRKTKQVISDSQQSIENLQSELAVVNELMANGDFLTALSKVKSLNEQAVLITAELQKLSAK